MNVIKHFEFLFSMKINTRREFMDPESISFIER